MSVMVRGYDLRVREVHGGYEYDITAVVTYCGRDYKVRMMDTPLTGVDDVVSVTDADGEQVTLRDRLDEYMAVTMQTLMTLYGIVIATEHIDDD